MKQMMTLPLWSYQFERGSAIKISSREEVEAKIVSQALKDRDFKARLIENPVKILLDLYGIDAGMKVQVVEEVKDEYIMVLPANPYADLSSVELENFMDVSLDDIAKWVIGNQGANILSVEDNLKVVLKAWTDVKFKNDLIKHPKKIIEESTKARFAEEVEIRVLEETSDILYMVIPYLPDTFEESDQMARESLNLNLFVGSHRFTHFTTCLIVQTFSCGCRF